jgi:two-component system chemotaxis response regulator CheY
MANILVVDDSASIRNMVSFTLKQQGHQVTEAVDGNAGLAKARTGAFDLVLTDVNMPGMDGITLCGELRKLPNYKTTPILILTTESSAEMKQKGKSVGATGWLVKPVSPEKLVQTLQRVIR